MHFVPGLGVDGGLVLLAPADFPIPYGFKNVRAESRRHRALLADVQRLRGSVYLDDGAIAAEDLSSDGRHQQKLDRSSWHMVGVCSAGKPRSCVRYRQHKSSVTYSELSVSSSAIALSKEWGTAARTAVEDDLALARQAKLSYVELGGWAIAPEWRFTSEAIRLVLATYAVWRMLGGALGVGTVTLRNHSASIMRRLGGSSLRSGGVSIPRYSDQQYGCEMELLRFASDEVSARFNSYVETFETYLENIPVILPDAHENEGADYETFIPSGREFHNHEQLCLQ